MAKITLDTITSSFASTSLFNTNFSNIQTDLNDKVLYRDNPAGEPNQMETSLDMNSNDISNVADITASTLTLAGTQVVPGSTELQAAELVYDPSSSTLTTTKVQDAIDELDGNLTGTNIAVDNLESTKTRVDTQISRGSNHGKNFLINGDMSVWQRGTSGFTSGYGPDRWVAKSGFTTSSRTVDNITSDANWGWEIRRATTGAVEIEQRIEADSAIGLRGKPCTLSFNSNAYQGNLSSVDVSLYYADSTDNFSSATLIETVNIVSPVPFTTSTAIFSSLPNQVRQGLLVRISFNVIGDTKGTITLIQLEEGTIATDFEYVPPADQLDRCQRYYEKSLNIETAPGTATLAGAIVYEGTGLASPLVTFQYKTTKRSEPAITFYSTSTGDTAKMHDNGIATDVSATAFIAGQHSSAVLAGGTPSNGTNLTFHYTADAEL